MPLIERNNRMADIISGKSRFNGQKKQTDSGKVIRLRSPEEEKDTLDEQYVKEKIKRHRRNVLVGCLITAAAVFILVLAALFLLDGRTYSQYTVLILSTGMIQNLQNMKLLQMVISGTAMMVRHIIMRKVLRNGTRHFPCRIRTSKCVVNGQPSEM